MYVDENYSAEQPEKPKELKNAENTVTSRMKGFFPMCSTPDTRLKKLRVQLRIDIATI